MSKLKFLLIMMVISIIGMALSCTTKPTTDPNIVLIVIDTLRADHLPFYGYKKNTAPFLSGIASRSLVFENAYSTSSWTAPATASIFTSLYPFQHKVYLGFRVTQRLQKVNPTIRLNRIPAEINTVAEVLKEAGYKTFAVTDNLNINREQGFADGFDHFENFHYETAEVVNDQVKTWENEIKGEGKYFLYLHYMDPHVKYHKRQPWYKGAEDPILDKVAAYDSEINYVDDKIREMFEQFNWGENTIVIVTSDHGEEFKEHGGYQHGKTLYQEVLRVPLLIYLPAGGLDRKKVENNVSVIDILPTIRALIGLPIDSNNEGIDLISLSNGKSNSTERKLYSHLLKMTRAFQAEISQKDDQVIKSVINNNWKYIWAPPNYEEFYNLENDPEEKSNKLTEFTEKAMLLKSNLLSFEKECNKYQQEYYTLPSNEKLLKELKSLGYVK